MSYRIPTADELTIVELPDGRAMIHDKFGEYDGPYNWADARGVIADIRAEEERAVVATRKFTN